MSVQPEQMFNLIFGYNAQYLERAFTLNAGGANVFLFGAAVDPDEVWVVTAMGAFNNSRNPSSIALGVNDGSDYINVQYKTSPGTGGIVSYQGLLPMKQGDKAFAYFKGCVSTDDLYLDLVGYKMKLTQ